eukprot:767286-Hanusia_phi.AAC.3
MISTIISGSFRGFSTSASLNIEAGPVRPREPGPLHVQGRKLLSGKLAAWQCGRTRSDAPARETFHCQEGRLPESRRRTRVRLSDRTVLAGRSARRGPRRVTRRVRGTSGP